jgi:hypothetical protein
MEIVFASSRLEVSVGGFIALAKMHTDLSMLGAGTVNVDFANVTWVSVPNPHRLSAHGNLGPTARPLL